MTIIDTSTASTATAYSNQRKVDRCQNGVLWSMFWNGLSNTTQAMEFWYSTDDGATWTYSGDSASFGFSGTGTTHTPNGSFFIDLDDYAHVVYLDRSDGDIYYRRGTPNAGRTSWTWSGETLITLNPDVNYPDIVAHKEGTGYVAHVVVSRAAANDRVYYNRVEITSGGTITVPQSNFVIGSSYSSSHKYPSIDFNHTGDGKTVAGGTPHLYAAWSAGDTGAGKGIRFKKATYSGGSWTWGTEREIDATRRVPSGGTYWLNCLFDGTRVLIGGVVYDVAADLWLWERDAEDTTTTSHALMENTGPGTYTFSGSMTYDAFDNVYFFGYDTDNLIYRRWYRPGNDLESPVVIDSDPGGYFDPATCAAMRGYIGNKLSLLYTDGAASPYDVVYESIEVNTPPDAPTINSPADDIVIDLTTGITFDWTHSDPDGDLQTGYVLKRRQWDAQAEIQPEEWWNGSAWVTGETSVTTTNTSVTISTWPASDTTYQWALATVDSVGDTGAYSAWRSLNPYEFWDGSQWVSMTQSWISSSTEESVVAGSTFDLNNTYKWTVATKDTVGLAGPYATEKTITAKSTPTVTAVSPDDDIKINLNGGATFSWNYSDADGDPQTAYRFRRRNVDTGEIEYYAGTNTWSSIATNVASSSSSPTIGGWGSDYATYEWSVAVFDGNFLSTYTAWRTINPYEWYIGQSQTNTPNLFHVIDDPAPFVEESSTTYQLDLKYSNSLVSTSNGVLWYLVAGDRTVANHFKVYYSEDKGETWSLAASQPLSGTSAYADFGKIFLDIDDNIHFVYSAGNDTVYYQMGMPNATRTDFTWSSRIDVSTTERVPESGWAAYEPDVVAHRHDGGWIAHVVFGAEFADSGISETRYVPIRSRQDGSLVVGETRVVSTTSGSDQTEAAIDFKHTGDGKTVKDNDPRLFLTVSIFSDAIGLKTIPYIDGDWDFSQPVYDPPQWTYNGSPSNWDIYYHDGSVIFIFEYYGLNIIEMDEDLNPIRMTDAYLILGDALRGMDFSMDTNGNIYGLGEDRQYLNCYKWINGTNRIEYFRDIKEITNNSSVYTLKYLSVVDDEFYVAHKFYDVSYDYKHQFFKIGSEKPRWVKTTPFGVKSAVTSADYAPGEDADYELGVAVRSNTGLKSLYASQYYTATKRFDSSGIIPI